MTVMTVYNHAMRPSLLVPMLLLAGASIAHAQTTEISSPNALGMGGAFRALAYDNSAIDLNPAGTAQVKRFSFQGAYYRTALDREYAMQVSVVDSLTNTAATGFAIEYRKVRPGRLPGEEGFESQKYMTSVGVPLVPQKVAFGFNTKYIRVNHSNALPARRDESIITGDFGVLYRPFQMLAVGATFDNLIDGGHRAAPRGFTGGAAFLPAPWVTVSADVFVDMASTEKDETGWAVGAQLMPHRNFSLRAGAYEDALTKTRIWTAGLGLNAETGTIDYACRFEEEKTNKILTHYISFSFFVF